MPLKVIGAEFKNNFDVPKSKAERINFNKRESERLLKENAEELQEVIRLRQADNKLKRSAEEED